MGLELIESLEQEQLANALVEKLNAESPSRGILDPATAVVQNAGLGRWLRLWHARQTGVSAGIEMPFARSFIGKVLDEAGLYDEAHAIDGDALAWQIFRLLSERVFEQWGRLGEPLQAYLSPGHATLERRCWQLASQVAASFGQYAIYRPEWLISWLSDEIETEPVPHWGWQALLFRAVAEALETALHEMERRIFGLGLYRFGTGRGTPMENGAPLHVFGINSFSPSFLRFFKRLSESRTVNVYHLVCSEAFLGDLPRNYRAALMEGAVVSGDAAELSMELDNPVLVASGQSAARFQSLLLALDYGIGDQPNLAEPAVNSDLQALQVSLRHNKGAIRFCADGTVAIHSCHSRKREVQVLQQQLLALFAVDPDLRPEDIMVLTPEIADYVDAIEAVFGEGTRIGDAEEATRIPYCVADQRASIDENCWRFLMSLLDLLKGRQPFSHVAALLDFEPVCERLRVSRDELQNLLEVLQAVGVRWGIDAETRAAQGHPEFEAHSWEHGMMRLYDGLIFPQGTVETRAPYAVASHMAEIVGELTHLLRPVFRLARGSGGERSFPEWSEALLVVARTLLVEEGEGAKWMQMIATGLGSVNEVSTEVAIGFATFCQIIEETRREASGPGGLLRRGVTFCRLQPVRHIPAKVICILGLNEGEYPRQERPAEFDLIDLQRRQSAKLTKGPLAMNEKQFLGDHRLRDEDRQLFLDCVLNARERLYLSYVGQSDKSNEPVPPSLLVSELIQFLEWAPDLTVEAQKERRAAVERILVRHPLQDWSRQNHLKPQPSEGEPPVPIHFERLKRVQEHASTPSFLQNGNGVHETSSTESSMRATPMEVVRFLEDPAHYYLKRRLQVDMDQLKWTELPQDWETLEIDALEASKLRVHVFEEWMQAHRYLGNFSDEAFRRRLEAELVMPPGLAGEDVWNNEVAPVLACLRGRLGGELLETERVEMDFGEVSISSEEWRVSGGRGLIVLRGALEGRYLVEAYLRHLLSGRDSLLVCLKDQSCHDMPSISIPEDTDHRSGERAWLEDLLKLWNGGQQSPIPFSLGIGLEYIQTRLGAKTSSMSPDVLLTRAYERKWSPRYAGRKDETPAQKLCFDGDSPAAPDSPFREQFAALAESILVPVVRWGESIKNGVRS